MSFNIAAQIFPIYVKGTYNTTKWTSIDPEPIIEQAS